MSKRVTAWLILVFYAASMTNLLFVWAVHEIYHYAEHPRADLGSHYHLSDLIGAKQQATHTHENDSAGLHFHTHTQVGENHTHTPLVELLFSWRMHVQQHTAQDSDVLIVSGLDLHMNATQPGFSPSVPEDPATRTFCPVAPERLLLPDTPPPQA